MITNYVGLDYQTFFEIHPTRVYPKFIDQVMKNIGLALKWDLSHDYYEYIDDGMISKEELEIMKDNIYKEIREELLKIHKKNKLALSQSL